VLIYKSDAPPSVSITTPAEGAVYAEGQTVDASYSCTEGAGGPGLEPGSEGCSGTVANGTPIGTSTPGEHHFTVTATSNDGLSSSTTVTYTVAAPPSASITTPAEGAVYTEGQTVDASYSCTEGTGGPGLESGSEGCSGTVANGTAIAASTPGEHHFTVTATSQDGLSTAKTVSYTVAAPPTAEIKSPATGGTYKQGEVIHTKFACSEGAGGTGIASCTDENSVPSSEEGTLETTMLGSHTYTVTAKSKDGLERSAKIEYSVIPAPPACKTAEGAGTYKKRGEPGRLNLRDKLSTSTSEAQFLQVSAESGAVHFGLKKLTSASCGAIEGGFAFSGEGPAREYRKTGYTIHFSISVSKGKTYFSSTLSKGATVIHEAIGEPLSKSNEVIH
jgi:hypothetical protein